MKVGFANTVLALTLPRHMNLLFRWALPVWVFKSQEDILHKIVLITGAPGSGKSTIARLLTQHFSKSLHLQVDQLREMMVNGIELPGGSWTDEATKQFHWARNTAIFMAQSYANQGVDVVIDDV